MRVRRQTVEHPFGTIKVWMGHALPNETVAESGQRNGSARAGVQHEARHADSGRVRIDGCYAGLRRVLARPNQPVQMTSGRHQGSLGSILEIFAAPIRQIFAGIDAPAIGAPIIRVFTQPGS